MRFSRHSFSLLVAGALALAVPALAIAADAAQSAEQVLINAKTMHWSDAPPSLPKGAKVVVLYGDPSAAGRYVMRMLLPANYRIPFHWHSEPQQLTVISGEIYVANDATYNKKLAHGVKAGGFVFLPAKAQQYVYTRHTTVFEIHGSGPFDVKYVDPNNDPEKWAQAKTYYFPQRFEANEMNAPEGGEPIPTF